MLVVIGDVLLGHIGNEGDLVDEDELLVLGRVGGTLALSWSPM